jgi:hypothetical protein
VTARLRESTGGHHATQAGAPFQQSKEGIQLNLYCATHAGKQEGDEFGESQIALASEILRVTPSRFEESGALDKSGEPG